LAIRVLRALLALEEATTHDAAQNKLVNAALVFFQVIPVVSRIDDDVS